MIKKFFMLSVLALCLVACGEAQDEASEPGPEASKNSGSIKAHVEPADRPNIYNVSLQVTEDCIVEKKLNGISEKTIELKGHRIILDMGIAGGSSIVYEARRPETREIIESVKLEIPKDLHVSGNVIAKDLMKSITMQKFGRVIFEKDSKLITGGEKILIETESLVSQGATIVTFESGFDSSNLDGGQLVIKAKEIIGDLFVEMRGKDGVSGAPGSSGAAGYVGQNGKTCQDGQDGGSGGNGGDGLAGTNGGNSGALFVEIKDNSKGNLTYVMRSGKGGLGGPGGSGGPGGAGGKGGKGKYSREHDGCDPGKDGHYGPRGADGKPGASGLDGFLEPVCVRIAGNLEGDCRAFSF